MTHLEQLIQDLCPNGVKRYKLKEIAELKRGVVISKDYINEHAGEYPVYSSQTENNGCLGYIDTYAYDGTYLTWTTDGANAGTVFYREGKFNITNVCGLVIVTNPQISVKYLYYILSITAPKYVNRGMGNPKLMSNVMQELQIPLPPLAVQSEIVRILDKFTLYKSELAAELAARLQQYEYYRDKLLTFDDTVKRVKLGEVAEIIRGGNFQKKDFVEEGLPCIHYGQIYTKYETSSDKCLTHLNKEVFNKSKHAECGDIVMAVTSENIDDVCKCVAWMGKEKIAVSGHTAIIKHKQNPKYFAYYFQTLDFRKQKIKLAHGTKVIEVTPKTLEDILIPLPPLSEQERIVSILDRFDKLCHDIREGLPAEIDLRQKQYEHYRDRLLTFRQLGD